MILEQFLNHLRCERNRSPLTVKSYKEDLQAFETYFKGLDEGLSWEFVDADIIRDWMEAMMDKGNAETTINRRLSAVRSLYRFALSRNIVLHDPARAVKGPKKKKLLPQFLKEKEMDSLLNPDSWNRDDYMDVCLYTVIQTFYETGIRLSELIGMDDTSVDIASRSLKVLGKGNKHRVIPFGKGLAESFEYYIAMRNREVESIDTAFFKTAKGKRIKASWLRNKIKERLSYVCTLKKKSPHVLRHTFATTMLNHDAGIENVSKLLGHKSLSTTEIYTHTTFEQLKRAYSKAHPRG